MNGLSRLFAELRRRNVLRAAGFYLASAWLLVQVITQIGPVFELPPGLQRWVIVALAVGFPAWLVLAWFYELTPDGIKRESEIDRSQPNVRPGGRGLDFVVIAVLAVAVVLLLVERSVSRTGVDTRVAGAAPGAPVEAAPAEPAEHSIAVLPLFRRSCLACLRASRSCR